MTDSIETSEREAMPAKVIPRPVEIETVREKALFAVAHPEVLHTPAMYQDIISGLLSTTTEEIRALEHELRVNDQLLTEHDRVLQAIPPCPVHGLCVPHALGWIEKEKSRAAPAVEPVQVPSPCSCKTDEEIGLCTKPYCTRSPKPAVELPVVADIEKLIEKLRKECYEKGYSDARAALEAAKAPWPQSNPWALAVDEAMVSMALDCTVETSDPKACVDLLVKHRIDVGAAQPVVPQGLVPDPNSASGYRLAPLVEPVQSGRCKNLHACIYPACECELSVEPVQKENKVILDKRDLFDFVRAEIKDSLTTDENSNLQSWLWEEATNRTISCLSKLYGRPTAPAVEPVPDGTLWCDSDVGPAVEPDEFTCPFCCDGTMSYSVPGTAVELPVVAYHCIGYVDGYGTEIKDKSASMKMPRPVYVQAAIAGAQPVPKEPR